MKRTLAREIGKFHEMATNSEDFSAVSDTQFPFVHLIYPDAEGCAEPLEITKPLIGRTRQLISQFPAEMVPKWIGVAKDPVFKFFVPPDLGGFVADEPSLDDVCVEVQVGMTSPMVLYYRTFMFDRPVRPYLPFCKGRVGPPVENPEFKKFVKAAFVIMEQIKKEKEKMSGGEVLMFLSRLIETRTEVHGFVPNKVSMMADICTYAVGRRK